MVETRFRDWASRRGFEPRLQIEVVPPPLDPQAVSALLQRHADCGPLSEGGTEGVITGAVATAETAAALERALADLRGDRPLHLAITVLNPAICAVRQALPDRPAQGLSIWLGEAATGAPNLAGIYGPGDYPLVEIRLPAGMSGLALWVGLVDVTGSVLNLLPNVYSDESRIDRLGTVANGVRTIRVMPLEFQVAGGTQLFALQVEARDFGRSELVAVVSRGDLFALRRPKDESVASFTEALSALRRDDPDRLVAVTRRLLESRPSR